LTTRNPAGKRALEAISALGERATTARVRTLEVLLRAPRPLAHAEVESELSRHGPVERVTLYRVLDWLVDRRLAHKIEGYDRVWRFNASSSDTAHAHFHCRKCRGVYCLTEVTPAIVVALPAGFTFDEAELSLRGACPACRNQ
jgi:Fur family ferric uptake transcriptional regulator